VVSALYPWELYWISSRNQVDETTGYFGEEIQQVSRPFEEAVTLLDTILGNGSDMAEVIVAELGADICRFPTAT